MTSPELSPAEPGRVGPATAGLTILIVDDTCLYREGLAEIIAREPGFTNVRTASDLVTVRAVLAEVVAGAAAADVRLERNTIAGAIQGVHAAASHGTGAGAPVDMLDRVVVSGNRISVLVPPSAVRGRHGVFVGNAQAILVTDNDLSYDSRVDDDRIVTDGIRGLRVPRPPAHPPRQPAGRVPRRDQRDRAVQAVAQRPSLVAKLRVWVAEDNMLAGARSPFIRTGGVLGSQVTFRGNRPGPLDTLDPRYQLKPA